MKCENEKCKFFIKKKDRQRIPNPAGRKGKTHVTKFKGKGNCILGKAKRNQECKNEG